MHGIRSHHRNVFDRPVSWKDIPLHICCSAAGRAHYYMVRIAGVILSATYAVIVGIKYRSKFNKYIFNFSNQVIAVMLYTIGIASFAGNLLMIFQ